MFIPESHPDMLIETMPYELGEVEREYFARQMSHFMQHTVQDYYSTDLGLERIDPDPAPGTPEELKDRIERLRTTGSLGIEYAVARRLTEQDNHQVKADAMTGLLVTQRQKPLQRGEQPTIHIVEFDVVKSERGTGLGRLLLQHVFQDVEDESRVTLDVAEANTNARAVYEHYGFEAAGERAWHGVFAVHHIPMAIQAATIRRKLGLV
jgi:ribosomal protein S18 acetylase RimI-like enzyme